MVAISDYDFDTIPNSKKTPFGRLCEAVFRFGFCSRVLKMVEVTAGEVFTSEFQTMFFAQILFLKKAPLGRLWEAPGPQTTRIEGCSPQVRVVRFLFS